MKFVRLQTPSRILSAVVLLVSAVTAGALLPAGNPTRAAEVKEASATVALTSGKISKEQATQNALMALPGTVTDVTIEKKHGKNVWVIEIVAAKDGAETDVLIDMNSGVVIGMDH